MVIIKTLVSLLVFSALSISAQAEYRAYELEIEDVESGEIRRVVTTLDHIQYPAYYPLKPTENIYYLDSWMCRGRTNNRPTCPNLDALNDNPPADIAL